MKARKKARISSGADTGPMMSVRPSEVPDFLRAGNFYQSLDTSEDDEAILVPANAFASSLTVTNWHDFEDFLTSLRHWNVDAIPDTVLLQIISNKIKVPLSLVEEFQMCFSSLVRLHAMQNLPLSKLYKASEMNSALRIGSIEFVTMLQKENFEFDATSSCAAAHGGSVACFELVRLDGVKLTPNVFKCGVFSKKIDMIKYLHETLHCPMDQDICELVYRNCDLECFRYAMQSYMLSSGRELECAAQKGSIPHMVIARTKCIWTAKVIEAAAMAGHLHCVQYAHENGCPWNAEVVFSALGWGHQHVVKYCVDNGCPHNKALLRELSNAVKYK